MDGTSKQVSDALKWLSDLGFRVTRSDDGQRDSSTSFEADDVRVGVLVDYSNDVAVHVGRIGDGGQLVENYGLVHIVLDTVPERVAELSREGALAERLAVRSNLLKSCAADLLSGDFSRRDRLKRLRAERTRELRKERFGTSTGETSRFAHRPTLTGLFSDAVNDGMRDARCVQAFWDYEYALVEIGAFLEEGEAQVQSRLDRWDGL